MGSHHHQVAALVQDEKLCVLIINAGIFSKQNKTSFIRDQCCHLADDGSPLVTNKMKVSYIFNLTTMSEIKSLLKDLFSARTTALSIPLNRDAAFI